MIKKTFFKCVDKRGSVYYNCQDQPITPSVPERNGHGYCCFNTLDEAKCLLKNDLKENYDYIKEHPTESGEGYNSIIEISGDVINGVNHCFVSTVYLNTYNIIKECLYIDDYNNFDQIKTSIDYLDLTDDR